MVSLGRNFNINTGAQYMEADNSNSGSAVVGGSSDRDNQELLDPVLASNYDESFKALRTVPIFGIHLLISTAISFTGVLLAAIWPPERRCEAYFIMLYLRAAFWIITFVFDHILKRKHDDLRMNGYHEFHRSTAMHKGIPLIIVSLWNTVILGIQAMMQHYYGENFEKHCLERFLSPFIYVLAFHVVENIIFFFTHVTYIVKVGKFNKNRHPPDALRGINNASGALGLIQPGANVADLLEKQADLIAYLRDHNLKLNQKLMQLNSQVRMVNITN